MSALEVIEQFKALPPQEKAVVMDFIQKLEPQGARTITYMSDEHAKAAGDKVLEQYKEVFQKLAQ
ncbi:MAG: hypothetical protein JWM16_5370 [Verrucomicrobiales bacterium]|nr:hypothetical protein [Verrucomicrobiales bacterium]